MLSEVICTEKLLCLVTLAKLVRVIQMLCPGIPVRGIRELFATEATLVGCSWEGWIGVECSLHARQRRAWPGMSSQMQRILVAFSLILVFEPIRAVLAYVLLF
jgi:hypothetical protein